MNSALGVGALAAVGTALAWTLSSIIFTLASLRAGAMGWGAVLGTGVALTGVAFMFSPPDADQATGRRRFPRVKEPAESDSGTAMGPQPRKVSSGW